MPTKLAPTDVRRRNRDVVLRHIVASDQPSRAAIADETGLNQAAVWRITRELIDAGLVTEGSPIEVKGQIGRRNVRLSLNNDGAYVLGIALGRNARSIAIANTSGQIVARKRLRSVQLDDPYRVLDNIATHVNKLISSCGIDRSRLLGAGVAVAGQVDHENGVLVRSDTLGENWSNIPVGQILSGQLGLPHRVESRPNALMLAERWNGQATGAGSAYLLNSSLGFGASQYVNGALVRPEHGLPQGILHHVLPGYDRRCYCGRKGCLEVVASGWWILDTVGDQVAVSTKTGPHLSDDKGARLIALSELADQGDQKIKETFREAGRRLGFAVSSVLTISNPQAVILAGIVGRQPDYFGGVLDTLRDLHCDRDEFPLHVSGVTSDDAAVWLGLDEFVYSRNLDIERLRVA